MMGDGHVSYTRFTAIILKIGWKLNDMGIRQSDGCCILAVNSQSQQFPRFLCTGIRTCRYMYSSF